MFLLESNNEQYISFPFSPRIKWKLRNSVIVPELNKHYYRIIKDNPAQMLVPGYFLEVLVCALLANTFRQNKIMRVTSFITPAYYADMLNLFGIKVCCSKKDNPIKEFERLSIAVNGYPVPIFFNKKDRVFFNLLNNYGGNVKTIIGGKVERSEIPFWQQIFQNICFDFPLTIPRLTYNVETTRNRLVRQYNIHKYVLLDNSNVFGTTADNRAINNRIFLKDEIEDLAYRLSRYNIKLVVMSPIEMKFNSPNIVKLNPWITINSLELFTLIVEAECVVSSDPNIYLSAALLDCEKVICLDNPPKGWTFDDVPSLGDNKWYTIKNHVNDCIFDLSIKG